MSPVLFFALGCGQSEPPPAPAPPPLAPTINMNPSPRDLAVLELVDLIGAQWILPGETPGQVEFCFVREGESPLTTENCTVEQFRLVGGSWYLRNQDEAGKVSAHKIIMVTNVNAGFTLRLGDGEAVFAWEDRSAGTGSWKGPGFAGIFLRGS